MSAVAHARGRRVAIIALDVHTRTVAGAAVIESEADDAVGSCSAIVRGLGLPLKLTNDNGRDLRGHAEVSK